MAEIYTNAAPQNVKRGTKDESSTLAVPQTVSVPIHCPLLLTFGGEGDLLPHYATPVQAQKFYGDGIIDLRGDYTTFNTPFVELFNRNANNAVYKRLVPEDAELATLRWYQEVFTKAVPKYVFDEDGDVIYENGSPKTDGTVEGIMVINRLAAIDESVGAVGAAQKMTGDNKNIDGSASIIYPIMDLPASSLGKRGGDYCFSMYTMNETSANRASAELTQEVGGRVLTLKWGKLNQSTGKVSTWSTINGAESLTFSFKKNAYYRPMRQDLDFDKLGLSSWRNTVPDFGEMPELGPVEKMHFYRENFEKVLTMAQAVLKDSDETIAGPYMVDTLSGLDVYGNPYNGLQVDDGSLGGVVFNSDTMHYLQGGSDGTMTNEVFDKLVRDEFENFGEGDTDYLNTLKHPFSWMWDSGFSTDTKDAMTNFIADLKHTNLVETTFVHGQGANSLQTEEAMKTALSASLRSKPESSTYATKTMRGHLIGHSMYLTNSEYTDLVPVSYSLAAKWSEYAGSAEGKLKPEKKHTRGELNIITEGTGLNLTYKKFKLYETDWSLGLVSVRSYDPWRYFFPALYTVYSDERSILHNWFVAGIIGNLEYLTDVVWSQMSGVSDMEEGQIIKAINSKLTKLTEGAYDGIVDLTFEPHFTDRDRAAGNSVSVRVIVAGDVMKTLFDTTIVATRRTTEES